MTTLIDRKPGIGEEFGEWTVTGDVERLYRIHWGVPCRCQCGTERVVGLKPLLSGASRSCGRCSRRKASTGSHWGRWKVLGEVTGDGRRSRVLCRCQCGAEQIVALRHLLSGASRSCGCYRADHPRIQHGESGTRLHQIWCGIRQRCKDPGSNLWRYYGGRGITVCPEWDGRYETFRDWARANGYGDDLVIDRRDTNGSYEPGNCRWVTYQENARNARSNHNVTAFGETKCLASWAEDPRCVVKYGTLWRRLKQGRGPEEALTRPLSNKAAVY
jgi:hypothetical protein